MFALCSVCFWAHPFFVKMFFLEISLSMKAETKARFPTDFYLQGNLISQKV